MTVYTIESLKEINQSYDREHMLTQSDVDKVNDFILFIEKSRMDESPQVGDIVEYTNEYGDYYPHAHVDTTCEEKLQICEQPYIPFASRDNDTLFTSTSGGTWSAIPKELKYMEKKEKLFNVWGHNGMCGNGAVKFYATVNVWEYQEAELDFTGKTHDKFHVSIREVSDSYSYKYIITKGATSYTAFRSDEEYQAWLKTFHGIEKETGYRSEKIVWTYKQESTCIPLEEYLAIDNALVDSELCNGSIQECKRIYNGTSVKTFLPYQNEKILLEDTKQYRNVYAS